MIIVLVIFFFSIIIEILAIGVLFSKIEIGIENLELIKRDESFQIEDFRGFLNIYLFKNMNLIKIKILKSHVKILGIKISYKKIFKLYKYKTIEDAIIRNIKTIKEYIKNIYDKNLKLEINKLDLNIDIGTEDSFFTAIIVAVFSSVIPIITRKYIEEYNYQKYKYTINPNYFNINNIKIKLKLNVNIETFNLIEELNNTKEKNHIFQN